MARPSKKPTNRMAPVSGAEDITIELSTRSAYRLWKGREKTEKRKGILGVSGFGRLLRSLEQAIREDDPYADYHYMQIEQAISELSQELDSDLAAMEALIAERVPPAMKVPSVTSDDPVVVPIKFSSRLGFEIVYQVLKVDQIALKILLASHLSLLNAEDKYSYLANSERKVRAVMNKIFEFRYTGVTRDDVAANNQKAQAAEKVMGKLDDGYLSGELRSPNAPKPPRRRQAVIQNAKPEAEQEEANVAEPELKTA